MEPTVQPGAGDRSAGDEAAAHSDDGRPPIRSGRHPHQPASVGFLLSQLGYATSAGFRDALAPLNLDPAHFATLRALGANEGQSQQAICAALHIPPSRMVALVDELEGRGLVERRINSNDRRARAVHLTDHGREILGRAVATAIDFEGWLSIPLDSDERQRLLDLLSRLAEHFELFRDVHPHLTSPRLAGWPANTRRRRSPPRG